jgi:microcystin-dependent protein
MPCEPAPPCEPNFPLFCDPLPSTTDGQRLVVEDSASCQKTLAKTSNPALLYQNLAGTIQFSEGSDTDLIKLPNMAEHQATDAPKIVVLLADGTMKAWEPSASTDNFLAYWDGAAWRIGPLATLFPSGDGVLIKNTLGQLSLVNGVAGESLQYVGTNIDFAPQALSPVPTGMILPYAAPASVALPSGYLVCDGSTVSQATYFNLYAIIGSTYNIGGEGAGDFRLPNLQGIFLRGSGTQTISGNTYTATLGAYQTDQNRAHRHFIVNDDNIANTAVTSTTYASRLGTVTSSSSLNYQINGSANEPTRGLTSESGGTESRPANLAMRYLIKT